MKYDESVAKKIELINLVLTSTGLPHIFENRFFKLNDELNFSDYVRYSVRKEHAINLEILISTDALQIDIDGMSEFFEWSTLQINDEKNEVIKTLELIFTSSLEIKRCGSNFRQVRFLDNLGNCVRICKYITGIYLPFFCKVVTHAPLFPSKRINGC